MVIADENATDLKPFYERASEAEHGCSKWRDANTVDLRIQGMYEKDIEERLSRLEAALARRKDESSCGNENSSTVVKELQMKLENMEAEIRSEQQKGLTLARENEKLKYQMLHVRRALDEAESEITSLKRKLGQT